MKIRTRFGVLVSVLLVFAAAFAGVILYQTGSQQLAINRLRDLVAVAGQAGVLGQELQKERAAAAAVLVGGASDQSEAFGRQTRATSAAAEGLERSRRELSALPPATAALLDRIGTEIGGLPALREQVRSRRAVALSAVTFAYRILIADLISYREAVAQAGAPADVADQIRASVALSRAAESAALEQVVVLGTLAPGVQVTPAIQEDINSARAGYTEALTSFGLLAQPRWRSWLARELTGPDIVAAQRLEDQVGRVPLGERVRVDVGEWAAAMSARSERLHRVEARADADVRAEIDRLRDVRREQTLAIAGGVLVVVLAAVVLAAAMGRPLVRRLRGLRDAAQWVAMHGLAQAVANLRDARADTVDPVEYAARQTPVAAGDGSDEIAEVGRAFNDVHREAVRTAVEQVLLRRVSAANLVHLSRRGQTLLDLLTRLLDTLERDEADPERLDLLYRLDNAVTRTKRVNVSLLLLGGAGVSVPRRGDVSLYDVLRAALSQIESYQRVEIGPDETAAAVMGGAVDEVAHLFAELLDNATRYSGPHAPVHVELRVTGDGVLVEIFDQGALSDRARERLNRRLASPDEVHLASVQSIGLAAVGMIAAHYGIYVRLRGGSGRGTVAEVGLPSKILRPGPAGQRDLVALPSAPVAAPAPARRLAAATVTAPRAPRPAPPGPATALPTQELQPVAAAVMTRQRVEPLIFQQVAAEFCFTPAVEQAQRAADRADSPVTVEWTVTGLPVRQAGHHLVPGAIPQPASEGSPVSRRRDPARSSAAAGAYSRGLLRGRTRAVPGAGIHADQGGPR